MQAQLVSAVFAGRQQSSMTRKLTFTDSIRTSWDCTDGSRRATTNPNFLRQRTGISRSMVEGSSMRKPNLRGNFSGVLLYLQARKKVQATTALRMKTVSAERAMLRVAGVLPIEPILNCRREISMAQGQTAQQTSSNSPYFTRYLRTLLNNFRTFLLLTSRLEESIATSRQAPSATASITRRGEFPRKETSAVKTEQYSLVIPSGAKTLGTKRKLKGLSVSRNLYWRQGMGFQQRKMCRWISCKASNATSPGQLLFTSSSTISNRIAIEKGPEKSSTDLVVLATWALTPTMTVTFCWTVTVVRELPYWSAMLPGGKQKLSASSLSEMDELNLTRKVVELQTEGVKRLGLMAWPLRRIWTMEVKRGMVRLTARLKTTQACRRKLAVKVLILQVSGGRTHFCGFAAHAMQFSFSSMQKLVGQASRHCPRQQQAPMQEVQLPAAPMQVAQGEEQARQWTRSQERQLPAGQAVKHVLLKQYLAVALQFLLQARAEGKSVNPVRQLEHPTALHSRHPSGQAVQVRVARLANSRAAQVDWQRPVAGCPKNGCGQVRQQTPACLLAQQSTGQVGQATTQEIWKRQKPEMQEVQTRQPEQVTHSTWQAWQLFSVLFPQKPTLQLVTQACSATSAQQGQMHSLTQALVGGQVQYIAGEVGQRSTQEMLTSEEQVPLGQLYTHTPTPATSVEKEEGLLGQLITQRREEGSEKVPLEQASQHAPVKLSAKQPQGQRVTQKLFSLSFQVNLGHWNTHCSRQMRVSLSPKVPPGQLCTQVFVALSPYSLFGLSGHTLTQERVELSWQKMTRLPLAVPLSVLLMVWLTQLPTHARRTLSAKTKSVIRQLLTHWRRQESAKRGAGQWARQARLLLSAKEPAGQVSTHFWLMLSAKRSGQAGQADTQEAEESSAKSEPLCEQLGMQTRSNRSAHCPGGHCSTQVVEELCAQLPAGHCARQAWSAIEAQKDPGQMFRQTFPVSLLNEQLSAEHLARHRRVSPSAQLAFGQVELTFGHTSTQVLVTFSAKKPKGHCVRHQLLWPKRSVLAGHFLTQACEVGSAKGQEERAQEPRQVCVSLSLKKPSRHLARQSWSVSSLQKPSGQPGAQVRLPRKAYSDWLQASTQRWVSGSAQVSGSQGQPLRQARVRLSAKSPPGQAGRHTLPSVYSPQSQQAWHLCEELLAVLPSGHSSTQDLLQSSAKSGAQEATHELSPLLAQVQSGQSSTHAQVRLSRKRPSGHSGRHLRTVTLTHMQQSGGQNCTQEKLEVVFTPKYGSGHSSTQRLVSLQAKEPLKQISPQRLSSMVRKCMGSLGHCMTQRPVAGSATVGSVQLMGRTHCLVHSSAKVPRGQARTQATELLSAKQAGQAGQRWTQSQVELSLYCSVLLGHCGRHRRWQPKRSFGQYLTQVLLMFSAKKPSSHQAEQFQVLLLAQVPLGQAYTQVAVELSLYCCREQACVHRESMLSPQVSWQSSGHSVTQLRELSSAQQRTVPTIGQQRTHSRTFSSEGCLKAQKPQGQTTTHFQVVLSAKRSICRAAEKTCGGQAQTHPRKELLANSQVSLAQRTTHIRLCRSASIAGFAGHIARQTRSAPAAQANHPAVQLYSQKPLLGSPQVSGSAAQVVTQASEELSLQRLLLQLSVQVWSVGSAQQGHVHTGTHFFTTGSAYRSSSSEQNLTHRPVISSPQKPAEQFSAVTQRLLPGSPQVSLGQLSTQSPVRLSPQKNLGTRGQAGTHWALSGFPKPEGQRRQHRPSLGFPKQPSSWLQAQTQVRVSGSAKKPAMVQASTQVKLPSQRFWPQQSGLEGHSVTQRLVLGSAYWPVCGGQLCTHCAVQLSANHPSGQAAMHWREGVQPKVWLEQAATQESVMLSAKKYSGHWATQERVSLQKQRMLVVFCVQFATHCRTSAFPKKPSGHVSTHSNVEGSERQPEGQRSTQARERGLAKVCGLRGQVSTQRCVEGSWKQGIGQSGSQKPVMGSPQLAQRSTQSPKSISANSPGEQSKWAIPYPSPRRRPA